MNILVTGGAGFIGSHLVDALLARGHQVTVVDDFSTGQTKNVPDGARLIQKRVESFYPTATYDAIYHLACPASPSYYLKHPLRTFTSAIAGTRRILAIAEARHIPILIASTSEVYGDPREHPQREEYQGSVNPVGPRACYNEGKRAAECLAMDYHRVYGTKVRIARIFNTYGPRMAADDGRVVPAFITAALEGRPLPINGSGLQTRSFCYVSDLVEGLLARMEDARPDPVNLGNPWEISIERLACDVCHLVGAPQSRYYQPALTDDPQLRCPDITRAREWLGWEPTTSLREGLTHTITYFRHCRKGVHP